jgi:putative thiazole/oxazole-modified microcin (TOMM)-like peptide
MEGYYVLGDQDRRKFAKIAAAAWMDEAFAGRYADVPYEVLAEHGISYPADVAPPLLPARPTGELSIESLESIAAGVEASISSSASVSSVTTTGTLFCGGTVG